MVVAVGITSEEVRSLASKSPAIRSARGPVLKSLVVSGDAGLRSRLGVMSELGGFASCDVPAEASEFSAVVDSDYQLVVIDIGRPLGDRVSDSVAIAEEFAGRPGTLLVICGSDDCVDEELWARQLGAWVYLPGISGGDALMSLFVEARRIAERRGACVFA